MSQSTENSALDLLFEEFAESHNLGYEEALALSQHYRELGKYNKKVIGVREFLMSPHYMDASSTLYPKVLDELVAMNSGDFTEVVLTGSIGCAKTTCALYTQAYQLYLLSCMHSPHREFDLDPATEIVILFQSVTYQKAKEVGYDRFRSMIERSAYFRECYPHRVDKESQMIFPNRVIVKPVSGAESAAMGENVIGGLIDEMNFMSMVEHSKRSIEGATYNQAMSVYNSLARRRKSRFLKQGKLPGILCLVSSVRYPGQFTDLKIEESQKETEKYGKSTIYVYNKATWDIKPEGTYSGKWFQVFAGDMSRKPRIMEPGEKLFTDDDSLIVDVPEEHRPEFESDIMNALRDIAGKSTLSKFPYIMETEKISYAVDPVRKSVFNLQAVDFVETHLRIIPENFNNLKFLRYAHIDLGYTGDSAGVAIGHVDKFVDMDRGSYTEQLPHIQIDGVLEVRPPRNGEILFSKIRDIFHALKKIGVPVRWITFDTYQSVDSIQLLRQAGFITGVQSMDRNIDAYEFVKAALYDGRISYPPHTKMQRELASLELDARKGKIDHPPQGSKDCSDALAGVVYGLTMRREIWGQFGVRISQIPPSIQAHLTKLAARKEAERHTPEQQAPITLQ